MLAEVVRRATGENIRSVLEKRIVGPLGFRWMRYGVAPADLPQVVQDALTGPPVPPPHLVGAAQRARRARWREVVKLANDPRFLTGIIPSANVVTTAAELSAFYQCLLDEGKLRRRARVRAAHGAARHRGGQLPRARLHAGLPDPLRARLHARRPRAEPVRLRQSRTPSATSASPTRFSWADPERRLAVALLASGKPVLSAHAIRLVQLLAGDHARVPEDGRRAASRARASACSRKAARSAHRSEM